MAFLIRKGTKVIVRKASGEVVAHTCKNRLPFSEPGESGSTGLSSSSRVISCFPPAHWT